MKLCRRFNESDIPALCALWHDVFGDKPGYIASFFKITSETGFADCVVLEYEGSVSAMACIINGLSIVSGPGGEKKCAYIYAVAVKAGMRGRGFGAEISRFAYETAKADGAEIVATLPADEGLYEFYGKICGMKNVICRSRLEITAARSEDGIQPVSAEEYNSLREAYLVSSPHLKLSAGAAMLLESLCCEYGGGLYKSHGGIFCVQRDGDVLIISEIISPDCGKTASAAACLLGCSSAVYYAPSPAGEKFILSDVPVDPGTFYGVAYE